MAKKSKRKKFSRKGAVLNKPRDTRVSSPRMASATDWYRTGDQPEYQMFKRDPSEVGLPKMNGNTKYACVVGKCGIDKTGKLTVTKLPLRIGY